MSYIDRKMIVDGEEITLFADGKCPMTELRIDINGRRYYVTHDSYIDEYGVIIHTVDKGRRLGFYI